VRRDDPAFLGGAWIIDHLLEQEAVELGFGEREDALLLDRVLRRDDHEAVAERQALAIDRDGSLLHRLEQRGLGLGRGAVDLVREQQFGKDRAARHGEGRGLEVEQVRPDDVAGHEIGGELNAPEFEPDSAREGARERGLGGARRAFEQDVAARQHRDQHEVDGRLLADHGLADLGADRPRQLLYVVKRHAPVSPGHE